MPLPIDPTTKWPPASPENGDLAEWGAWYSGSLAALAGVKDPFTGAVGTSTEASFNSARSERFWARQARRTVDSSDPAGVHVPLAGEIAQVSSDLLFGDMPSISVPFDDEGQGTARNGLTKEAAKQAQARIEDIITDGNIVSTLQKGAEVAAAHGGVYARVVWDKSIRDFPFLGLVTADRAVPEWRHEVLYAVTFWWDLTDPGGEVVYRRLERHEPGELAPDGTQTPGKILHGLYMGSPNTIGIRVDNSLHPATAGIPEEVRLPANYPFPLSVEYVSNGRPHSEYLSLPIGRSDFAGCESLLESLDVAMSSWMRDIEIGKGRVSVPARAMQPIDFDYAGGNGFSRGAGKRWDLDRTVYDPLNIDPSGEGQKIEVIQFKIRMEEHSGTVQSLIERIVSKAGYAPQTFGIRIDGTASTGTALRIRENRTFTTLDRKRGHWTSALRRLLAGLLAVDAEVFNRATPVGIPVLTWADPRENDPLELAQTVLLLQQAKVKTRKALMMMVSPELDEDQIDEAYDELMAEEMALMGVAPAGPVPDPVPYDNTVD